MLSELVTVTGTWKPASPVFVSSFPSKTEPHAGALIVSAGAAQSPVSEIADETPVLPPTVCCAKTVNEVASVGSAMDVNVARPPKAVVPFATQTDRKSVV